jgi:putative cell wall-binding protein
VHSHRRRGALLTGIVAAALAAASVGLAVPAQAADQPAPPVSDDRVAMGQFSADAYAAEASVVPDELAQAIETDLDETPAQYYANADAAANGVAVVDGLKASGTDVLGSRMEGTQLVVNVPDADAAAAVQAVGATAEVGAPPKHDYSDVTFKATKDLVGGQGYFSQSTPQQVAWFCSAGFNGTQSSNDQVQFLSAGHCVVPGTDDNGTVWELVQSGPGDENPSAGSTLGTPQNWEFGNGYDFSAYQTNSGWTPRAAVGTWNNNSGTVTAGTPVPVRDYTQAIIGQGICKSGRTSGWTCGHITDVDVLVPVYEDDDPNPTPVNADLSDMCSLYGDSGGAVMAGDAAVGLVSAGSFQNSCSTSGGQSATFPLYSPQWESVFSAEPDWRLSVDAAAPVVTSPAGGAPLYTDQSFAGTVPGGSDHYTVHLTIDGVHDYTVPVHPGGVWSVDLAPDLAGGPHSYSMYSSYAAPSATSATSSTVTGTFLLMARPSVSRVSGDDRYSGAVQIARQLYPEGAHADVVYVAAGTNYPDALGAGPAAAVQSGVLLLTQPDQLPDVVAQEIASLTPLTVVIIGGENSVSSAVQDQLAQAAPGAAIQRVAGVDRYDTNRQVIGNAFTTGAAHVDAATGTNFPDALSAGGAAGAHGEPVALVNGPTSAVDQPTIDLLHSLGTTSVTIVGGVNSVSPSFEASLAPYASVDRIQGSDRFQSSIAVNRAAFSAASTVYLATGYNFPDALAGGVLAGEQDAPLYVVPTDCVPQGVLSDIATLGATNVVLLGGPNSLNQSVADLSACTF